MKKYYLETLSVGCPKNILESASYRKTLEDNGYEVTDGMDSADVVILNTCGCLETIQNKAKEAINLALEKQVTSQNKIIVAGCYPMIDKANNLKENKIETFPPGEIKDLKKILNLSEVNGSREQETHQLYSEDLNKQPKFVTKPSDYYLLLKKIESKIGFKIQPLHNFLKSVMMTSEFHYVILGKGCMGNCTFCGIKLAIGNPESRSMNEIINNVRKGIVNKKNNIWLVSDDVGCWGQDIGDNSANLLKEILLIPSPMQIVINYFEPEMFLNYYEELKKSLIDPRVTQVCFPIQTGSQRLLKKMGRHYDIKEVLQKINEIKKLHPRLVVKTQYITSFPGETWWDFILSLWSMRYFDGIGVNSYARLKFTPAYKLKPNSERTTRIRKYICNIVVTFFHGVFVLKSLLKLDFEKGTSA